jgi:glycosyltransferase involved in cell wall biosynthesis
MPAKTLYICYFGVREPLVQTQVIPYLRELIKDDVSVSLLTFEPEFRKTWPAAEIASEKARLAAIGIDWHCLGYHKRPSAIATAYDIFRGSLLVWSLLGREKFDILHGRVHIPTLMGALARKFSRRKPKLLFDVRGFFPEEYTDAGIWPENGWLYRAAKRVEKWLLRVSDGFIVLTEKARQILFPGSEDLGADVLGRPVEVIPCCVDTERFAAFDEAARTKMRKKLGIESRKVLVYVGSFGGWYLTDEMFDLFAAARGADPNVFVIILTQRQADLATKRIMEMGFRENDFLVQSVSPSEIPAYLNSANMAVSFIKNCYSKQASSPTKNAEYLAAGLPIVANSGIGDVDKNILEDGVGVLVESFRPADLQTAVSRIGDLGNVADRCRASAKSRFDLESVGGTRYRRIYRTLLG